MASASSSGSAEVNAYRLTRTPWISELADSELGLERYVEAFEANDTDTAVLRALSADDLKPDAAVGAGGSDHRRGLLDGLSQQHSTSLVTGWIDGVASSHPKVQ